MAFNAVSDWWMPSAIVVTGWWPSMVGTGSEARSAGMRSGGPDMLLQTPLKPEQYESTGLSVAFSLIGLSVPPHLLQPTP